MGGQGVRKWYETIHEEVPLANLAGGQYRLRRKPLFLFRDPPHRSNQLVKAVTRLQYGRAAN